MGNVLSYMCLGEQKRRRSLVTVPTCLLCQLFFLRREDKQDLVPAYQGRKAENGGGGGGEMTKLRTAATMVPCRTEETSSCPLY